MSKIWVTMYVLRLCNFYCNFVLYFTRIASSLNQKLKKSKPKNFDQLTEEQLSSSTTLKWKILHPQRFWQIVRNKKFNSRNRLLWKSNRICPNARPTICKQESFAFFVAHAHVSRVTQRYNSCRVLWGNVHCRFDASVLRRNAFHRPYRSHRIKLDIKPPGNKRKLGEFRLTVFGNWLRIGPSSGHVEPGNLLIDMLQNGNGWYSILRLKCPLNHDCNFQSWVEGHLEYWSYRKLNNWHHKYPQDPNFLTTKQP